MQKFLMIVLALKAVTMAGQDTATTTPLLGPRHEIGLSVLPAGIMLTGATDYNERFTNLAWRYRLTPDHALKLFAGMTLFSAPYDDTRTIGYVSAPGTTVYPISFIDRPTNVQFGGGYEYMIGERLKHVIGLDAFYNYNKQTTRYYYERIKDSTDVNGTTTTILETLDTGRYSVKKTLEKVGVNVSYSLRYSLSRRWVVTCSMIATVRFQMKDGSNVTEFMMNGLLGDISLFYRF